VIHANKPKKKKFFVGIFHQSVEEKQGLSEIICDYSHT